MSDPTPPTTPLDAAPENQQPSAEQPPVEPAATAPAKRTAHIGTVVWGIVLVAFAAGVAALPFIPGPIDPVAVVVVSLVSVGVLLIGGGVWAALRQR